MNFLRTPISRNQEDSNDTFKRPHIPITKESAANASRSLNIPHVRFQDTSAVPIQAGCTTLKGGGYRKKVSLKPGHSALDWHALVTKKRSKGLVTRVDKLLGEDVKTLEQLNSPHSLTQLKNGVPPYLIKPPLRINAEILRKHNTQEDCWSVINGRVYSMTDYFDFHPGGVDILFKHCAGRDGTAAFNKYHRWVSVDKLLEISLVGIWIN
ncbi:hypothetical protein HG535_0D03990 [Zygotorulaspora mrakii]|uniref:Cytochrome b5 heme-binding domain-containing protein n=1 Tax=Zygotorulaspora mrakii TaxID=42260 RepID=A0A7H9B223_ZYGMR|nr:uncharacterized protein HG535_0D03990 [Zygotorulaspora mrakii]QLG72691.1 hypothetical protein HG535_0D03990 [Zygotorulaspora mrakii]